MLCCLFLEHPGGIFCFFLISVIRAKVLSQEVVGEKRVFNLQILETFKESSRLNETEGIHVNDSEQHSLFAKAYTERYGSACGVWLRNDTVYLLGGYIWKGKPQLDFCGMNKEWSQVTSDQRLGIRGVYDQNCECRISPCFSGIGCGKLKGCAYSWLHGPHSYCLKNANGTACSWNDATSFPGLFPSPFPSKLPREKPWKRGREPYCFDAACSNKATNITFYVALLYLLIFL